MSVSAIISDKAQPKALDVANSHNIPFYHIDHKDKEQLIERINELNPALILLAGYLRLIPSELTENHSRPIVNVHPALLPAFGGQGMYGDHVHRAVVEAGAQQSGITIHYVNAEYDKGAVIAQFHCPVQPEDTVVELRMRVRSLEHRYLPLIIESLLDEI